MPEKSTRCSEFKLRKRAAAGSDAPPSRTNSSKKYESCTESEENLGPRMFSYRMMSDYRFLEDKSSINRRFKSSVSLRGGISEACRRAPEKNTKMAENFATDQFSLRWNNFTNNLTSGFMSHLSDEDLVDVTLAVDGQLLQAHKLVLSVCSPYFKDIFKRNPCQHPVVILRDMGFVEVESLLRFMYQGEVNVRQEELASFLRVAEILQIKGLTGDGSGNRNDSIKEEDRASSRSEALKLDKDSDSNEIHGVTRETISYDTPILQKRRSRRPVSHSTKRSRTCVPALKDLEAPAVSPPIAEIKALLQQDVDNDRTKLLSKRNSDESADHDDNLGILTDDSIDLTRDDTTDEKDDQFISDYMENEETSGSVVEPVTYRLSARGRPQLVHAGYVYNLTSRSEALNRSHYRCAEQHRGCKGKCAVIAERFMPTGVQEHNHAPGYQSENDYRKKKGLDAEQN